MENKEKIRLEYAINASPKLIYNRISTPSGLSEWFCDDVNIEKKCYKFIWDRSEQYAKLLQKKENQSIRFRWVEDLEDEEEDDFYFELKISQDELTGDVMLTVTDFAEADEVEETTDLWNKQIEQLKYGLGA